MTIKYIGICGTKGSGKTTLADIIIKELKQNKHKVIVLPFAKGIKEVLATTVSMITKMPFEEAIQYFIIPELKETIIPGINTTARHMMIAFGTDFVRNINEDLWITYTRNQLETIIEEKDNIQNNTLYVIFDDIRFENEHDFVKHTLGGNMLYISKDKSAFDKDIFAKIKRWVTNYNKHKSEKGLYHLCNSDMERIINTGTLQELRLQVYAKTMVMCF